MVGYSKTFYIIKMLPNSSPVMLLIPGKFTPPIVYKLLLMDDLQHAVDMENLPLFAGVFIDVR